MRYYILTHKNLVSANNLLFVKGQTNISLRYKPYLAAVLRKSQICCLTATTAVACQDQRNITILFSTHDNSTGIARHHELKFAHVPSWTNGGSSNHAWHLSSIGALSHLASMPLVSLLRRVGSTSHTQTERHMRSASMIGINPCLYYITPSVLQCKSF